LSQTCPYCGSSLIFKAGFRVSRTGERIQRYLCRSCLRRFSFKSPLNNEVKVNIVAKPAEALNPAEDLADGFNLNPPSSEPGFEDSALPVCKDVGPHASTIAGKGLNRLLSYNSKRRRSERDPPTGSEKMNPNQGDANAALLSLTGEGEGLKDIPEDTKGELIGFAWWLRKQGLAESTITNYCKMLRLLLKHGANLKDPESVKEALARLTKREGWKALAIMSYSSYLRFKGLSWEPPRVEVNRKMPFIPIEEELDALIAGCGPKTSCLLQLIKETGMRIGEALRLKWSDVDFQRRVIILNQPEKHGNPRIFRISDKLMGMLNSLPRDGEKLFSSSPDSLKHTFLMSRRRLAAKLNNPRLLKIKFHMLRHWKATMEYHRTKDILRVKELLGHKNINNTLLYVQVENQLFSNDSDEFIVKVAKTPEEIKPLLEVGFEYVCEKDGLMFFRKRR
jgi:integrase